MAPAPFQLTMSDGFSLHVSVWNLEPEKIARGIVQIAHGMCEHSQRYSELASFLNAQGWIVVADDHRGHGLSAKTEEDLGFFALNGGWSRVVQDLREVTQWAREQYPDLPVFLLGHSMGSFLARTYLTQESQGLRGCILSSTGGDWKSWIEARVGQCVAKINMRLFGAKNRSNLIRALVFGPYNNHFKPKKTDFDWLSRDESEVLAYINDPLCGFQCTSSFYRDLFHGVAFVNSSRAFGSTPKDLPILMISGDQDPLGKYGAGVKWIKKQFEKAGVKRVQLNLYPSGRHEMFKELNKEDVFEQLNSWLQQAVDSPETLRH